MGPIIGQPITKSVSWLDEAAGDVVTPADRAARYRHHELRREKFDKSLLRTTTLSRAIAMWYFTWILGVGFAAGCGILNALWHEQYLPNEKIDA
jgi:cytochrome bd-I ubiquinol oxidase subunit X